MSTLHRLTRTISALALTAVLVQPATAQLSIGFESPPYVTGTLQGQEGWAGGVNFPRVQTASEIASELTAAGLNAGTTVHGGSQALLVTSNPAETSGGLIGKPVAGLASEPHVVMDWWARPLTSGLPETTIGTEQGNTFVGIRDAAGNRAAALRFGVVRDANNAITGTTIDFGSASAGSAVWVPSGLTWAADEWFNFRFELDYGAKRYDLFVNGTKANNSPIEFYQLTSTTAANVFISRGQNNAGQILDDFNIMTDFDRKLLLTIDPTDGNAVVKNNSDVAVTFDSYTIGSASNSLLPGWASLKDQSVAGWQEAVPTTGRVSELNPNAAMTLNPGQSLTLDGLWNTAGVQNPNDLSFQYRDTTIGTLTGVVQFGSSGDGDFDNDGDVDGADFLRWQRGESPTPNSASDLAAWKSTFGAGGAGQPAVAGVPEPASALLVVLALGLLSFNQRRG
jgi:hypothetical protein